MALKKIVSVLCIGSVLLSANSVYADNKVDNTKEAKEITDKLLENREEQATLDVRITELDASISDIESKITVTLGKIAKMDEDIVTTKLEIEGLNATIASNEESLGKRLKVINNNYSMGYLKVMLSSTSLSDFFNNMYVVKQVVEQDRIMLKELDEDRLEVEQKEKFLEVSKKEQEVLKEALFSDNKAVMDNKTKLESLKLEVEKEEATLEKELEKLALESSGTVDLSGVVISSGSWPAPGRTRVSSPYGYRNHPILNKKEFHTGIDIPAPKGTPAVAIDNGVITFSGVKGSYGNTIMIKHDDGKVSLYAHNSELVAKVGQRVEKGEVVSKIGSTGMSTGSHLHFEIRINGKHTNPMPYIKG